MQNQNRTPYGINLKEYAMETQAKQLEKILEPGLEKALEQASEQIFGHQSDQIELFLKKLRSNAIEILSSRLAQEREQYQMQQNCISETESALASIGGLPIDNRSSDVERRPTKGY
jgi:vacuolar-type H+-ATPase subunit C/Vma6